MRDCVSQAGELAGRCTVKGDDNMRSAARGNAWASRMGDDRPAQDRGGADNPHPAGKLDRLIKALPAELQREFEEIWRPFAVAKGAVLLEEGDGPSDTGYVIDGLLGMVKELSDGRRHIIGLLAPADLYGRTIDGPAGYRIEALADSTVLVCDRARLEDILNRSPEAEHLFQANLLDEIDAAREWMLVLSWPKVVQRVASFLLILCRRKLRDLGAAARPKHDDLVNLHIAIRRADLAQYLGARPELLSRAFHELQDDGIIRINDPYDFDLLDIDRLVDVAGHDLPVDDAR